MLSCYTAIGRKLGSTGITTKGGYLTCEPGSHMSWAQLHTHVWLANHWDAVYVVVAIQATCARVLYAEVDALSAVDVA